MDQKLQLQLQPRWLHYTTTTTPLHYNYNCTTSHYIQQLWVRWPLQTLQPVQETQLRPPFGPSVDSLCHPWFTIHLSYRFPIFETSATGLCGTTGTAYMHHDLHWDWQSFSNVADLSIASRLKVKVSIWSKMRSSQTMANSTQGYYGKNIFRTLKTKLRLAWEGWVSPVFLDPRIAQWRTSALDLLRLSSLIECSNQDLLHMEPITESPMRPILHVRIILKLWIFLEGTSGGLWKIVVQLPVAFLGSCNRTHENWKRWN